MIEIKKYEIAVAVVCVTVIAGAVAYGLGEYEVFMERLGLKETNLWNPPAEGKDETVTQVTSETKTTLTTTVIVNTTTITRTTHSDVYIVAQDFTNKARFHLGDMIYREPNAHRFYFHGFQDGYIVIGHSEWGHISGNILIPSEIGSKFYLMSRLYQILAYDVNEGVIYLAW